VKNATKNPAQVESPHNGYFLGFWNQFLITTKAGQIVAKTRLIGSQSELVSKLSALQTGSIPPELISLINAAENQEISQIFVENTELVHALRSEISIKVQHGNSQIFRELRFKLFGKSGKPPQNLVFELAQQKVFSNLHQPEKILFRLLRFYHRYEATKIYYANLIRESGIIYLPELTREIENPDEYLDLFMEQLQDLNESDLGSQEFIAKELDVLNSSMEFIYDIRAQQDHLKENLSSITNVIAPNLTQLIGSLLTAELITRSSSLKFLAYMPAGKVQLLGATQARRYIKGPKYGILYQSEHLSHVPTEFRGRLARTLSALIAIAAKADYFTKAPIYETLNFRLMKRIQKLGGSL
jgi:RNA processing factor Prp31